MNRGEFIVGSIRSGMTSIAADPVLHTSVGLASKEAERLAKQDKGTQFVVYEVKGIVECSDVVWK